MKCISLHEILVLSLVRDVASLALGVLDGRGHVAGRGELLFGDLAVV